MFGVFMFFLLFILQTIQKQKFLNENHKISIFFYSGESKSEFLLISHHARTEKDIRHLLAEPVGRR